MKLKHLLLAGLMSLGFITSCGGTNATCKVGSDGAYKISDSDGGEYKYICVDFHFWIKDGKNKKVTKNTFYAKVNDTKVEPACIFSNIKGHSSGYTTNYWYESIVEEKELTAGTETYITQSNAYVGFDLTSGVTSDSKFYVNNTEVNMSTEVAVKL